MDKLLGLASARFWLILVAVAIVVSGLGGFSLAWRLQDAKLADQRVADLKAQTKAIDAALRTERSQNQISADAGKVAAEHQASIEAHAQIIRQEIPIYVTREADARCIMPLGAFRVLDSAATGLPVDQTLGGSAEPNDAPSGVDCSRFVDLVAEDFKRYRAVSKQLNDFIDLANRQAAAAPASP